MALCLHRLQAGDPPAYGEEVDRWYDQVIGQNVRVMWMKVKPVAEKLKGLGVLDRCGAGYPPSPFFFRKRSAHAHPEMPQVDFA